MSLPQITSSNLREFLNKEEILNATIEQIVKDFSQFKIHIHFSGSSDNPYDELLPELSGQLNILLKEKKQLLFSLLYRIDVSERELANAGALLPDYSVSEILADVIIRRELKKVLTRMYYANKK